jgi:hypothetical protein
LLVAYIQNKFQALSSNNSLDTDQQTFWNSHL